VETPSAGRFCWKEVNVKNSAVCGQFYRTVFGWDLQQLPLEGTSYTVFKKDGQDVGGMLQMTAEWANVRPHWMAYVAVADCDATAQKITETGGKVCVPPTDISVGRFAVVEDPDGAVFSIIKLKPT
jgi:predicted enzyme related to lactoylglutathione lyase